MPDEAGVQPKCGNCAYFIDHAQPDDLPDEPDGYCGETEHHAEHADYGGHWTHSSNVCPAFKAKGGA